VVHRRVEVERELVARADRESFGAVADLPAHVAAQVGRGEVGHRAVLKPRRIAVAPDVLPHGVLGAGDGELLEDVVRRDGLGGQSQEGGEWLCLFLFFFFFFFFFFFLLLLVVVVVVVWWLVVGGNGLGKWLGGLVERLLI
jgi:hypothetical protein